MQKIMIMTTNRYILFTLLILIFLTGLIPANILSSSAYASERKGEHSACTAVLLKNQEYFPALIKAIDEAKSEIIMSFFLFKAGVHNSSYPDRLLAHLTGAVQRGVKVVVILENSGGHDRSLDAENGLTKELLEKKGVEVYLDSPRKTTHTKLVVIDQRFILLGSHNLTQSALKYNNEISILLDNPDLAREAREYMQKIIKEAK
jgi:phosphatidylserine/phosphatidylglycerophosphate/cardiolipin synthase-like enzyme